MDEGGVSTHPRDGYRFLILKAMHDKSISKTVLLEKGLIRKCTFRRFHERLREGTLYIWELDGIIDFLKIERIGAILAVEELGKPEEYFEPTTEAASHMVRGMVVSLTARMAAAEGNFNPMLESVCRSLGERNATSLIERNQATNELRNRAFA